MATPSGGSDAEPPRAQQRSLRPPKAPANVCRPVNVLPPVAGLHVEHHDAKKNRWLSYRLHGDIITDLKLQGYGACALDSCKEVCIGVLKGLLAAVDVKYEKGQLKGGLSLFMQVPSMRLTFEHPQVKYALRKSVSARLQLHPWFTPQLVKQRPRRACSSSRSLTTTPSTVSSLILVLLLSCSTCI